MSHKKKILFILPSLCAGGAERVMSFVSSAIDKNKYESKLIVIGFKKDAVYEVEGIEVLFLNKTRLLAAVGSLFGVIRKEKPAIVVSSIGHVNVMMALFSFYFWKVKFIGREASVVSKMNEFSDSVSKFNSKLMRFFYPRLSAIICQSSDMKEDFQNVLQLKANKLKVIHNPITKIVSPKSSGTSDNFFNFITVGRLSKEKGHQRILQGLSTIKTYDFTYTIVGSGPLEQEIKKQVIEYNLLDKVTFIPFTTTVLDYLKKSDYFLQGSFVEGFPNALLESCTVGVPIIVFDAPGGTKDVVSPEINGFVVKDNQEFETLLNDKLKLDSISNKNVLDSVLTKFDSNQIVKKYEELFDCVLNE